MRALYVTGVDALPTADDFRRELRSRLDKATVAGLSHLEVASGDIHRAVGGYPGPNHRMPVCCEAVRSEMRSGDRVVAEPPRGQGATLTIRYQLPRS